MLETALERMDLETKISLSLGENIVLCAKKSSFYQNFVKLYCELHGKQIKY